MRKHDKEFVEAVSRWRRTDDRTDIAVKALKEISTFPRRRFPAEIAREALHKMEIK